MGTRVGIDSLPAVLYEPPCLEKLAKACSLSFADFTSKRAKSHSRENVRQQLLRSCLELLSVLTCCTLTLRGSTMMQIPLLM